MFDLRFSRNVLGLATVAAGLTACGSDAPGGPGTGALDVTEVTQAQAQLETALEVPVIYSLLGTGSEGALAPNGRMLDVDGPRTQRMLGGATGSGMQAALRNVLESGMLANAAAPDERDEWYVNPELWGQTYVKDAASGQMEWDESRTDAPTRGVRIALYQRTGAANFNNTIVGWLDVIDSSSTTQLIGRANIRDAQQNIVGTFRATSSETGTPGATTVTVSETFAGTIGVAPRTFVVADTVSGTRAVDGGSASLRWRSLSRAEFADVSYSILATGFDDETGETAQAELQMTVGEHTTRIEGAGAIGGDGNSNVYIDDQLVARVTYDAETEEETVTGPNGGPVSTQVQHYFAAVSHILALLPNATVLHFVILIMFAFI